METAIALPEASSLEQQERQQQEQQGIVEDTHHTVHDSNTHSLDDTEDYGPLKKKHKYRDDRDKDKDNHQRSGSISFSEAHPSAPLEGGTENTSNVLDSSANIDGPSVAHDAATTATAGGDQDHPLAVSTEAIQQQQQQQQEQAEEVQHDERSISRDLAGSPGSVNEKARKHNFYVPSREVAFLLDNLSSAPTSSDFPSIHEASTASISDGTGSANALGGDNTNISEAQSNANALLSIGTSITGRQAAKIAAMEAKEKLRISKELELEEARNRKKNELERKRLENARKKAEKNNNTSFNSTSLNMNNNSQDGILPSNSATTNTQSKTAANRSKRTTAPRRSNAKTKLESPELPIPPNTATTTTSSGAFPSPDIKISSPSTSNLPSSSSNPHNNSNNTTNATITSGMQLPPMPEPATEGMMGFIPYASEGARAAALAKAAKQQKLNGSGSNAGSPPSSISISLPNTSGGRNGKSTSNSSGNRASSSHTTANQTNNNNRRGNNNNNNSKMNKSIQNIVSQQQSFSNSNSSISGRASPTNALEHAAAAIDAVLDAGAAARAQAIVEEEEVDDRLYCIQLYDPERLMIACDRCDNWYHVDCVNIDESSITLIDLFICPICEKDSGLHTVSKSRCSREECNEPALKLSKYCSDLCGIKVAALQLEQSASSSTSTNNNIGVDSDKPENLRLLWDAVSEVKKLETVVRSADDTQEGDINNDQNILQSDKTNGENTESNAIANGIPKGIDLEYRIKEEEYRLAQLQNSLSDYVTKRQNLELSLSLINARLSYLQLAIRRWELTVQEHAANKPTTAGSTKNRNKNKSASNAINADAPCGFDVRLVWDDKDWQEWLDSDRGRKIMSLAEEGDDNALMSTLGNTQEEGTEDEDEEGLICTLSRRKCDRHSAWQKLRDADFQVEKAANEKQLEELTESERRIRRRVEDIQDFLRRANEKLEAEKSSKKLLEEQAKDEDESLAIKLADEGGGGEDVEMSDSMPPTPALVVQEA